MRNMFFIKLIAIVLSAIISDSEQSGFDYPQGPAMHAIELLKSAGSTSNAEEIRSFVEQAASLLGLESPAGEKLRQALIDMKDLKSLQQSVQETLDMLTFEPLKEAELPEGFPTYTPAGAIELKVYPKHRRAVANQFFTLFGHITRNQIAMTTPVRMEFDINDGKLQQESMAFYYGNPSMGSVGDQGPVEVVEKQGETVLSLGQRGRRKQNTIADGERRLRAWLAAHPDYEASGKLVVMGYNSPMVPAAKQFFEIQLPVKEKVAD